ncbi:MAG: host specificity protein [Chloroflexi bacterium]|nr:host specificity protein [Chloroflexota bacterium]MBE42562.1 host specificity protein [Chloroflexota bacterium]|tara:strand:+ start:4921 stop:5673 length:753 start_codon:yes stop_codon:yes gene_type:complete
MAELRQNRAKQKLRNNETVIAVNSSDTDMIDFLGSTGLVDMIWIEMEHGSVTWGDLGDISRVCDLWGMTSLVRVNNNDPWLVGRALDRGAQGVVVPHVDTKSDAERLVRGGKFTPVGKRGMGGSRQGLGVTNYIQKANDEILLIGLIEDVEAIDNLDEILTVEGIDCLMVVPGDLSQSMGPDYLGHPDHPEVKDLVEKTMKRIVAAGYSTGSTADDSNIGRWVNAGGRMFLCQFQGYIQNGLKELRNKAI